MIDHLHVYVQVLGHVLAKAPLQVWNYFVSFKFVTRDAKRVKRVLSRWEKYDAVMLTNKIRLLSSATHILL